MGTKMKGLLKGLRYISQIFESDGKEQEMQIGFPTDVKHVAHIGWDGPSVSAPSWMNEFRSAPLSATVGGDGTEIDTPPRFPSAEFQTPGNLCDAQICEPQSKPRPRTSRRSSGDSPNGDSSRPSRRQSSAGAASVDSPARESSDGSRHSRRHRSNPGSGGGGGGGGADTLPQQDLPAVPKQSRRRKTKGTSSSGGGSSRSSRNKAAGTIPEIGADDQILEPLPPSKPAAREEEGL